MIINAELAQERMIISMRLSSIILLLMSKFCFEKKTESILQFIIQLDSSYYYFVSPEATKLNGSRSTAEDVMALATKLRASGVKVVVIMGYLLRASVELNEKARLLNDIIAYRVYWKKKGKSGLYNSVARYEECTGHTCVLKESECSTV